MDNYERTLPIGSIVLIEGANKRLMIIGYCRYLEGDEDTLYDYVGVPIPEGFQGPADTVLFNHEDIIRLYSLGFQDNQRFAFAEQLKLAVNKLRQGEEA